MELNDTSHWNWSRTRSDCLTHLLTSIVNIFDNIISEEQTFWKFASSERLKNIFLDKLGAPDVCKYFCVYKFKNLKVLTLLKFSNEPQKPLASVALRKDRRTILIWEFPASTSIASEKNSDRFEKRFFLSEKSWNSIRNVVRQLP